MVSRMALSRLAGARNVAEQAGLEGTAERIELLRKELLLLKDLPEARGADIAAWAIAKADETKRFVESEAASPKQVLKDRQAGHDIRALCAKIALYAGSMFSGLKAVLSDPEHPIMLVSGFVTGTVVAAGIIDHLIGSKNEKDAAAWVVETLDSLRKTLARGLWKA